MKACTRSGCWTLAGRSFRRPTATLTRQKQAKRGWFGGSTCRFDTVLGSPPPKQVTGGSRGRGQTRPPQRERDAGTHPHGERTQPPSLSKRK